MSDIEQVRQEAWVIDDVGADWIRLRPRAENGGGEGYSVPRQLLPDDVEAGDEFRVVAYLDRTARETLPDACVDALVNLQEMYRSTEGFS